MKYTKIVGMGSYLPRDILSNADLEKKIDTTDEWIVRRVGIKERRIIGNSEDTTSSMATQAAKNAIKNAELSPSDIDLIIVATVTSEYAFPSVACLVQQNLDIDNDSPAFDVSAACAGFIYGMNIIDQYIRSGVVKNALLIGAESLTKLVDWEDRATCILFGDGAGALVLQASEQPGIMATTIHASGKYVDKLYAKSCLWNQGDPQYVHMDGKEVFKLATLKLGEIVEQTLVKAQMNKTELDWLIPHQANFRIIQAIARRLDLSMEQVILTIEKHGNTSAASVPLALVDALQQGKIKRGDNLMLEAFGGGFAWGAALIRY